jgi:hypothetical protein
LIKLFEELFYIILDDQKFSTFAGFDGALECWEDKVTEI